MWVERIEVFTEAGGDRGQGSSNSRGLLKKPRALNRGVSPAVLAKYKMLPLSHSMAPEGWERENLSFQALFLDYWTVTLKQLSFPKKKKRTSEHLWFPHSLAVGGRYFGILLNKSNQRKFEVTVVHIMWKWTLSSKQQLNKELTWVCWPDADV